MRSASSFVQVIFFCAAAVAYLGVAAGMLGLIKTSSATLVTLIGCAVGCAAGLALFMIWQRALRPPVNRVTQVR
jgi:hypothetical protein